MLPGMSPEYEHLSSVGTPLSIFALANDYLMSGHREARIVRRISLFARDSREVRENRDWPKVSSSRVAPVAHVLLVSLMIHEQRFTNDGHRACLDLNISVRA